MRSHVKLRDAVTMVVWCDKHVLLPSTNSDS